MYVRMYVRTNELLLLSSNKCTAHRVAQVIWLHAWCSTQDRLDLAFAAKELSRRMAAPSVGDLAKLKRALRYLRGHPVGYMRYVWQDPISVLTAQVDSDWAGCARTRKSTSGGLLCMGQECNTVSTSTVFGGSRILCTCKNSISRIGNESNAR